MRARWRWAAGLGLALTLAGAFELWVRATVLPDLAPPVAGLVVDRDGALLRAYPVEGGTWRMAPGPVDPGYLAQVVAFEDKRFWWHGGVDPLALARAAAQAVWHGRVVSGGSTLTMQVARLLERGPTGRLVPKLRQMRVAWALERRLGKAAILDLYLTLAPFGGNIEGVRAAALAWFGHEPGRLDPAEAALLVALPQAPEARRPDRAPAAARAARDRVLARAVAAGVLAAPEAAAARAAPVPVARRALPLMAAHRADRAAPGPGAVVRLELDRAAQAGLEALARDWAATADPDLTLAMVAIELSTGRVRAQVGSAGYDAPDTARRRGRIDMSVVPRSPGSALKPFVYGLAFDLGLAHPETLIEDRPMAFGRYRPQNFDLGHQGTVSMRRALALSLNVPAVAVLAAVGPARLTAGLRRAGVTVALPPGRGAGLALALGGAGVRLDQLTAAYAALGRGGRPIPQAQAGGEGPPVLGPEAAWAVGDVLSGTPPPPGAPPGRLAFKTGTSYGHRDAWALGFDGRHAVGVWVGRADGAPVPGMTGIAAAAPLVFEAFARLGPGAALPPPPPGALAVAHGALPAPLRRFGAPADAGPEIAYPPDGARIEPGRGGLVVKLRGGTPPFTWLVDGAPQGSRAREIALAPRGPGPVAVAVIDAAGRAARVQVELQ